MRIDHFKHFSFDLWFTLIKSNPDFKKERALYFYKHLNSLNKTILEVEMSFRTVDLMCNAINEKTGQNITAEEMYLMVIYQLNNSLKPFEGIDCQVLYKDMEMLLLKQAPSIFSVQTTRCLNEIKQLSNITLNILSNTAFIKGSTIKGILDTLDLTKYFDFQIYSDEVGVSKPNSKIYDILLKNIFALRVNAPVTLNEIVHIGDNPVADIKGAQLAGINAFQINSNGQCISNLIN